MSTPAPPWPPAAATGVGSMPGTDAREAARIVAGECDLPHVPELPARGAGADLVGRTAALLAAVSPDLAVQAVPTGWRLTPRPGRDSRRALSWLAEDLDAVEEQLAGAPGPLKTQLAGPWTLAAGVELAGGQRLLRDAGACRELCAALAEAAAEHVRGLRRRLPGARVVLQLDEPSLPAVLAGAVPTASGLARHRAVDPADACAGLRAVVDAAQAEGAAVGVHCCASAAPVGLLRAAGAAFLGLDADRLAAADLDALAAAVDGGALLLLGVLPAVPAGSGAAPPGPAATARRVLALWQRLGFAPADLPAAVALSPACGMAGAPPGHVRAVLAALRAAGAALRDPDG